MEIINIKDAETYDRIKNEMFKTIEESYLKDFHKEMKKFQIITIGYNVSKHKSLQVFKEYGWKLSPVLGRDWMNCLFRKEISSKCVIHIALAKNMKTGILTLDSIMMSKTCDVNIHVGKSDKLFELIKQLENYYEYNWYYAFANESIKCNVFHEGYGYKLVIYPLCSNNNISYTAYATDKMLQNTIGNRELEAESYLINDILDDDEKEV